MDQVQEVRNCGIIHSMDKHTYITSHPKILGGTPVIAGTRVPINVILYRLKEGYTLKDIHNMYSHVSLDTLQKVIDEIARKLPSITTHDKTFLQA